MHRERVRVWVALLGLAIGLKATPATCQPVGSTVWGDCGLIVMGSGELLLSHLVPGGCPQPQEPWVVRGNVFASSGTSGSPIVGMSQTNFQVLAANGDWFQLAVDYNYCGGAEARYLGNAFQLTGSGQAGETFVTFGGAGIEYGVTTLGNVYRWQPCGWLVVGNVYGGPVDVGRSSWGGLKMMYR